MATVFTIGHSTRPLDDFIHVLKAHSIESLVDVRSFPMSRRYPHFNREALAAKLAAQGIGYAWLKALGGRRSKGAQPSLNVGLHSLAFRNYADHMLTPEFEEGARALLGMAQQLRTAYMCAERVYFRCHRMLISDWLVAHGHEVLHLDGAGAPGRHQLTAEARMIGGILIYPAA